MSAKIFTIETAIGSELDVAAEDFGLYRRAVEPDDEFRLRVRAEQRRLTRAPREKTPATPEAMWQRVCDLVDARSGFRAEQLRNPNPCHYYEYVQTAVCEVFRELLEGAGPHGFPFWKDEPTFVVGYDHSHESSAAVWRDDCDHNWIPRGDDAMRVCTKCYQAGVAEELTEQKVSGIKGHREGIKIIPGPERPMKVLPAKENTLGGNSIGTCYEDHQPSAVADAPKHNPRKRLRVQEQWGEDC